MQRRGGVVNLTGLDLASLRLVVLCAESGSPSAQKVFPDATPSQAKWFETTQHLCRAHRANLCILNIASFRPFEARWSGFSPSEGTRAWNVQLLVRHRPITSMRGHASPLKETSLAPVPAASRCRADERRLRTLIFLIPLLLAWAVVVPGLTLFFLRGQ